jgi:hypothetical protein
MPWLAVHDAVMALSALTSSSYSLGVSTHPADTTTPLNSV